MSQSALICPGQGAQRAGGLNDLPASARLCFDRASAVVGVDLWELGLSERTSAEQELQRPSRLQPYLVAWAVAEWEAARLRLASEPEIGWVTGHSSGLNSALVLSGAVTLDDALRFAFQCGLNMDQACDEFDGGLLALVGADRAQAQALAARFDAALANHNAPDQTVLGGSHSSLADAAQAIDAPDGGPQTVQLRVAGAFHTDAFAASDERNRVYIDKLPIASEFTPLIGNCRGQLIRTPQELRAELRGQYGRPVEWLAALDTLYALGVRRFLTLGPGNAMAGLVRRFGKARPQRIRIVRLSQSRRT